MAYFEGEIPTVVSGNNSNGFGNGFSDGWWGIILIALLFGWGRGGYGFGGGNGGNGEVVGYELGKMATQADIATGFNNSAVLSSLNDIKLGQAGLQQTLCQGFSGVNTSIMQNGYETRSAITDLGYHLQDCCCKTQNAIQGVNYNIAQSTCALQNTMNMNTRDLIENQNANYRAIHEELVANKIEAKNERIAALTQQVNALQLAASQQAQNAYITANQEAQTAELIRRLGRDCPIPAYVVPNPNCCYGNPVGVAYNQGNCCASTIQ